MVRRLDLFVYGTLQPHAGTRMGKWIASRLESAGPASLAGTIHAVRGGDGWFPALRLGGDGRRVVGTLCRLGLNCGELARLDHYEGREYRRMALSVRCADGRRVTAQTYLWRVALPEEAVLIVDGDYLGWLDATGRKPFSTPRNGV